MSENCGCDTFPVENEKIRSCENVHLKKLENGFLKPKMLILQSDFYLWCMSFTAKTPLGFFTHLLILFKFLNIDFEISPIMNFTKSFLCRLYVIYGGNTFGLFCSPNGPL